MPVYDPDSIGITAGQIDKIKDEVLRGKGKITGVPGENPFGTMGGSEGVNGAVGSFTSGMHTEFDAAANHMNAASAALRKAAGLIAETEQVNKDNITVHEPGER